VTPEVEQIEEIADRRAVDRHIGIVAPGARIRQIVPAAPRQRIEPPVALDEFQDRDMVG
jgi:hypothetical protein